MGYNVGMIDVNVKDLIRKAKEKYPISVYYEGKLSEDNLTILEKECNVHCIGLYMDGAGTYSIRYRKATT